MPSPIHQIYKEDPTTGNEFRHRFILQLKQTLLVRRADITAQREQASASQGKSIFAYESSQAERRRRFIEMLGWPLSGAKPAETPGDVIGKTLVAEDESLAIYRLEIPVLQGLHCYGLLHLPKTRHPARLVIAQHGALGTAERVAGFFDSSNYNRMTQRLAERGYAVFTPQLLLNWPEEFGPKYAGPLLDHHRLDAELKQVGGSLAALHIFMLRRALDYLLAFDGVASDGAAIAGLSYGGFYALAVAACDLRIRAVVSSCFLNDRFHYAWPDLTWFNSASCFTDKELCGLICPRPLYVEVGDADEVFDSKKSQPVAEEVATLYRSLHIGDRFKFVTFSGGHEFNKSDTPLDFLVSRFPPSACS